MNKEELVKQLKKNLNEFSTMSQLDKDFLISIVVDCKEDKEIMECFCGQPSIHITYDEGSYGSCSIRCKNCGLSLSEEVKGDISKQCMIENVTTKWNKLVEGAKK